MRSGAAGLNLQDSVYERLLAERIIFLGSQVDDDIANRLCAQILLLAAEDPTKDISLTSTRRAGRLAPGMAIYDTMVLAPCDVATYAMGMAPRWGEFLLAGTKGKRYALPHARILMHQPLGGITAGRPTSPSRPSSSRSSRRRCSGSTPSSPVSRSSVSRPTPTATAGSPPREALEYGFVDHHHPRPRQWSQRLIFRRPTRSIPADAAGALHPASFVEHSSWGVKVQPLQQAVRRNGFPGRSGRRRASANDIMAQLLVLESLDPEPRDITMYINSRAAVHLADGDLRHHAVRPRRHPDGLFGDRPPRRRRCCWRPARPASGSRCPTPGAHPSRPQPSLSGVIRGQFSDLEIRARNQADAHAYGETLAQHRRDAAVILGH